MNQNLNSRWSACVAPGARMLAMLARRWFGGGLVCMLWALGCGLALGQDPVPNVRLSTLTVAGTENEERILRVDRGTSHPGDSVVEVEIFHLSTSPSDVTLRTPTVSFSGSQRFADLRFRLNGDVEDEPVESFEVRLVRTSVGAIDPTASTAVVAIANDRRPQLHIDDLTVSESVGTGSLRLWLNRAATATFDVTLRHGGGSATVGSSAPADLDLPSPWVVSFPAGTTEIFVPVRVLDDPVIEPVETAIITATPSVFAPVGLVRAQALLSVTNDDLPHLAIIPNSVTVTEGDVGSTPTTLTVTLSQPIDAEVSVDWATESTHGAVASRDYETASGTVSFAPGESVKTITVNVLGDRLMDRVDGGAESFSVRLSRSSGGTIATDTAVIYIGDDDVNTIAVSDGLSTEGDSSPLTFQATVGESSDAPISFRWVVEFGPEGPGEMSASDLGQVSGTVTFAPQELTQSFVIPVLNDVFYEGSESVRIVLTALENGQVSRSIVTGTVADDEMPPTLRIEDTAVTEGGNSVSAFNAWFRVTLSQSSLLPVAATWSTIDGSGTADVDYKAAAGTLTFQPGEQEKWLRIPVVSDDVAEAPRTFSVQFRQIENATAGRLSGEATIQDTSITSLDKQGKLWIIRFPTGVGQHYLVEENPSLSASSWRPNSTVLIGSGAEAVIVTACDAPNCYFRVRVTAVPPSQGP